MRLREEAAEGHPPTPPCCRFCGKKERLQAGEETGTELASSCCTLFVSYRNYQSKIQIQSTLVALTLFRASIGKQRWWMHNIATLIIIIIIVFQLHFYGSLHGHCSIVVDLVK